MNARTVYAMAPSGDTFVRAVMKELGCASPAELAETMGWKRGTERLVAKWLAGSNNPSYERTLEMLDRAGWLSMNGARPAVPTIHDPLAKLEATVEAQGKSTTLALKALTAGIQKLEQRLEAEAPQATGRAARK